MDLKSFFYEWSAENNYEPIYSVRLTGSKNCPRFVCEIRIPQLEYVAVGISTKKKDAEKNALTDYLAYLMRCGQIKSEKVSSETGLPAVNNQCCSGGASDIGNLETNQPYPPFDKENVNSIDRAQQQSNFEKAEFVDDMTAIYGNWTIENAKPKLHQFMQINNIVGDYKYTENGPDHAKCFVAEMHFFVPQLKRYIYARENAFNKQSASKLCALSVVHQLYHLGAIEASTESYNRKRDFGEPKPYRVPINPTCINDTQQTISIDTYKVDQKENYLNTVYNHGQEINTQRSDNQTSRQSFFNDFKEAPRDKYDGKNKFQYSHIFSEEFKLPAIHFKSDGGPSDGDDDKKNKFNNGLVPQDEVEYYRKLNANLNKSTQDQSNFKKSELVDNSAAAFFGNWTIENAKPKLHQFMQINNIVADYKYAAIGPDHCKSYVAEMHFFVHQLGHDIYARESASNKQTASKLCALSMVHQLYHLGAIEAFNGCIQKMRDFEKLKSYQVAINSEWINHAQQIHGTNNFKMDRKQIIDPEKTTQRDDNEKTFASMFRLTPPETKINAKTSLEHNFNDSKEASRNKYKQYNELQSNRKLNMNMLVYSAEQAELVDGSAALYGNWTIENSQVKLNQFMQRNRIVAAYKYTAAGPGHARSFTAEMNFFVRQLNHNVSARATGSNKQIASKLCALSMVHQLYNLGAIERYES